MQQMLANLRARREDERGFTLIELMVVVLIIAILIAIAIPTFLGAKSRAQDKAAQSSLRNALTNAKGIYTDTDSYSGATTTALGTAEPSLTFTAGVSTGPKNVSVLANGPAIVMAAKSAGGTCYVIGDVATGPGTIFAALTSATTCTTSGMTLPTSLTSVSTSNAVAGATPAWASAW
ncbi:MAG: prepilin-type N-terminal cleavage/methylation domain-containing protein [Acidimicrobiia bacterium]